jgi:nitrate reductase NapAB chaperone NapD
MPLVAERMSDIVTQLYTLIKGEGMPVSGVVLCRSAGCADKVVSRIAALDGAEVHGVVPDNRIVAVIEAGRRGAHRLRSKDEL